MKRKQAVLLIVAIFLIACTLTACATHQLPPNPTPEQQKTASCSDARQGVIVAVAAASLTKPGSKEERAALAAVTIAQQEVELYCK